MNKPLTASEQQHLSDLLVIMKEHQKMLQDEINRFVDFLRNQHDAPAQGGWALNDLQVGFVLPAPPAPPAPPQAPESPESPVAPGGLEKDGTPTALLER